MSPRLPARIAEQIEQAVNRRLSAEELTDALTAPMSGEEIAERRAQIAWFCRHSSSWAS